MPGKAKEVVLSLRFEASLIKRLDRAVERFNRAHFVAGLSYGEPVVTTRSDLMRRLLEKGVESLEADLLKVEAKRGGAR